MKKLIDRVIALENACQNIKPIEEIISIEDCATYEEAQELFLRKTTRQSGIGYSVRRQMAYQSKEQQEISYLEAQAAFANRTIKWH